MADNPNKAEEPKGPFQSRIWRDLLIVALTIAPIGLVYFLPTDTSLAEVEKRGVLSACVPTSNPPLVMQGSDRGFDVRMLEAMAERMGVELRLNVNPAIGKDFNPRNWRINRAQCEIVAGGIVVSDQTRSFLETLSTGIQTGWALVIPGAPNLTRGMRVGVLPGAGGLDRVALSSQLRQHGIAVTLAPNASALAAGLAAGTYDAAITESLGARNLAAGHPDWTVAWLPPPSARYSLGYGLWKGDLTLKRRLEAILSDLQQEGFVQELEAAYGILPIVETAQFETGGTP